MNRQFEINGLKQPLEAVCEALRAQDKESFALSLEDIYNHAKRVPELEKQLRKAVDLLEGYPANQWEDLGLVAMIKALI